MLLTDLIPLSTLGSTLVLGAVGMAAVGSVLGFVSGARKSIAGLRWARALGLGFAISMILANLVMIAALLSRDFTVSYVAEVGTWQTPLHITIVSLWASLTGSILLWGGVLGLYVLGLIVFLGDRHRAYQPWTLGVLLSICVMFGLLVAGIANPFAPTPPAELNELVRTFGATAGGLPADGPGPNPLLQNHWLMIIHPPTLYLGYVGMALPFSMSAAALLTGRLEAGWMAPLRRAFLVPWVFLTVGIVLGGWWSYAVLGWGGYWAWDPVENASFMPWLTGTAFLHSSMLMQRRTSMKTWTLILGMVTFILTLFGTFLTRSGVFNSVHAFGTGAVGPVLLTFIAILSVFSIVLLALREHTLHLGAHDLPTPRGRIPRADQVQPVAVRWVAGILLWVGLVAAPALAITWALWRALPLTFTIPIISVDVFVPWWGCFLWLPLLLVLTSRRFLSRDFVVIAQNGVFAVFTFAVFLGTIYPILSEALRDKKVSVGEPFFDAFGFPLGVMIVWLMGLGPMLPWGQRSVIGTVQRFIAPLGLALLGTGAAWLVLGIDKSYTLLAIFVCLGALFANLGELVAPMVLRLRKGGGPGAVFDLLRKGRRRWGGHIAHYGVIICVLGVAISKGYQVERDLMLTRDQAGEFSISGEEGSEADFSLRYVGSDRIAESHRVVQEAHFEVYQHGQLVGVYSPALNKYPMRSEALPYPAIRSTLTHDLYLSLLSVQPDGSRASVHVKWIPGVIWIWISALIILFGTSLAIWPDTRRAAAASVRKSTDKAA